MIWIAFLASLCVSFLFSGIESGVLSVNRVRLRHYALRGEEAARKLDAMLSRIERLVATVVLITNAANVVAITLLYRQFGKLLGESWGATATLVVAFPLFVLGLEFLPKAIFRRFPYRTLVIFARILTMAHWVLGPVVNLGAWLLGPIFRKTAQGGSRIVSVEDLRRHMAVGGRTEAERDLIEHVVDFRSLTAADLMIPMDQVPHTFPDTPIADLLKTGAEEGTDRFLVVDRSGGASGMIQITDLLYDGVSSGRVQSYVRRIATVAPEEIAIDALVKMRGARLSLAVVADSAGRPLGVLVRDQLVRRLLGGEK